jgi:site-specific DNA recombinase
MRDSAAVPVALYARYSTDRQDTRSIEDQLRRCREHAAARGFVVVAEYSDAAISGAHLDRAELQRMLADVRRRGGPPFRAVLVDDLSRLSRDLGDTWRIIFEDLAIVGVKVIDVTTGMASDSAGARLTFGALALVNDTFLQLVRSETHRGLAGRALAGFWTGGKVYGYTTVEEPNPPDPEHRRKIPVLHPDEAEVVRRIFTSFAEGVSLKNIADTLNREGITAPHDHGRGHKIGRGWGHSTVRAMLLNERYAGKWTWNTMKWVRIPGKKTRRKVRRPEAERVVRDCPELAIIQKDLWELVQGRFRRTMKAHGRGRPAGTGTYVYLVSGLLRCGVCGGSMTVMGRRIKAGVRYATFGCTTHNARGPSICPNSLTISERKATTAILGALQDALTDPLLAERFHRSFERRLGELSRAMPTDTAGVERRLQEAEGRIRNVTEAMAKIGYSEALLKQLRIEEDRLAALQADQPVRRPPPAKRLAVPPERIQSYVRNLVSVLETDPVRGRERLGRHLALVKMTPEGEGPGRHYRASGAFNLSSLLKEASGKSGSGGEI